MSSVVDLFAGCGGFSCGFEQAGFNISTAVEFDAMIAESYARNHKKTKIIADDIKNVDNNNVFQEKCADVIIGGPPCQGFSMAGARIRNGFIDDPRNYLFKHYFNVVKIIRPKFFILENVKGILTLHNGKIFDEIKSLFQSEEHFGNNPYQIQYKVVCAKDFGIPQNRERVVIIGSQKSFSLETEIEKTKNYIINNIDSSFFEQTTVWDAISNLPNPTNDGIIPNVVAKSRYQKFLSTPDRQLFNHNKTQHSTKALERIKKININENYTSLDENIKSIHSGSYGRLDPDSVAPTITTRFDTPSGGRFIHPYENRTITPREAARLQSFPDSFTFVGNKTSVCKQIGNAVPPKLAYFFGIMLRRLMENE